MGNSLLRQTIRWRFPCVGVGTGGRQAVGSVEAGGARLLGACHAQSVDLAVVASGRHRVVRRLAAAGGQVELHLQTKSGTMDCSGLPGRR